jgi:hypothetical protein
MTLDVLLAQKKVLAGVLRATRPKRQTRIGEQEPLAAMTIMVTLARLNAAARILASASTARAWAISHVSARKKAATKAATVLEVLELATTVVRKGTSLGTVRRNVKSAEVVVAAIKTAISRARAAITGAAGVTQIAEESPIEEETVTTEAGIGATMTAEMVVRDAH